MDKRRDHRESKGVEDLIFILFYLYCLILSNRRRRNNYNEKSRHQDKRGCADGRIPNIY